MQFLYEETRKINLNKTTIENSLQEYFKNDLGIKMDTIIRPIYENEFQIIVCPSEDSDYKLIKENIEYYNKCVQNIHKYANLILSKDFVESTDNYENVVEILNSDEKNSSISPLNLEKVEKVPVHFKWFSIYFKTLHPTSLVTESENK